MYKHRTTGDVNKQRKFTFLFLPGFVCYLQSIKIAETVKMCFLTLTLRRTVVMVGVSKGARSALVTHFQEFICLRGNYDDLEN